MVSIPHITTPGKCARSACNSSHDAIALVTQLDDAVLRHLLTATFIDCGMNSSSKHFAQIWVGSDGKVVNLVEINSGFRQRPHVYFVPKRVIGLLACVLSQISGNSVSEEFRTIIVKELKQRVRDHLRSAARTRAQIQENRVEWV